ncbi:MAG: hypothetical protein AABZ53_05120 [Planctomycetota bacterium]
MPSFRRGLRRLTLVTVAIGSLIVGWLLLWHLMSPGVAAGTPTGVLIAVLSLQMLPLCAAAAWWWDRSTRPAINPHASRVEASRPAPTPRPQAPVAAPISMLVHRVVHAPRVVGEPRHQSPNRQRKTKADA